MKLDCRSCCTVVAVEVVLNSNRGIDVAKQEERLRKQTKGPTGRFKIGWCGRRQFWSHVCVSCRFDVQIGRLANAVDTRWIHTKDSVKRACPSLNGHWLLSKISLKPNSRRLTFWSRSQITRLEDTHRKRNKQHYNDDEESTIPYSPFGLTILRLHINPIFIINHRELKAKFHAVQCRDREMRRK